MIAIILADLYKLWHIFIVRDCLTYTITRNLYSAANLEGKNPLNPNSIEHCFNMFLTYSEENKTTGKPRRTLYTCVSCVMWSDLSRVLCCDRSRGS